MNLGMRCSGLCLAVMGSSRGLAQKCGPRVVDILRLSRWTVSCSGLQLDTWRHLCQCCGCASIPLQVNLSLFTSAERFL